MNFVRKSLSRFSLSTLAKFRTFSMSAVKIGTHNGTFHCDEVLACYMLKQCDDYKDAEIVRTRDPSVLATCDIVVDVGGVYDPTKHRYDHHQKTFCHTMHSLNPAYKWTTKLSSSGLVYFHFGHAVIGSVLARLLGVKPTEHMSNVLYEKVYELFMEEVDGVDNGINVADGTPRYAQTTGLSSRVSHYNPWWNQDDVDENAQFHKAMKMVGAEFEDRVNYYACCWWPARTLVEAAVRRRTKVDPSGEIVEFTHGGCPWKDHMFTIEAEHDIEGTIKFVIYPDQNAQYRVQCVPLILGKFDNRLSLPAEWRGLRDEELSAASGIPDCVFVHSGGFIGGNKTRDGALEMARKTITMAGGQLSENGSGEKVQ